MRIKTLKKSAVLALLFPLAAASAALAAPTGGANGQGSWTGKIDTPVIGIAAANLPNGNVLLWSSNMKTTYGGAPPQTYTSLFDPITQKSSEQLVTRLQHDMFCPGTTSLADGSVLISGGSSSGRTSIYAANASSGDGWTNSSTFNVARGYHASVMLPSGSVFTVGGSWSGDVGGKIGEIWHESTGWQMLPGIKPSILSEGANDPEGGFREDNHAWLFAAPGSRLFHAGPGTVMHWLNVSGEGSSSVAGTRSDDVYSINGTVAMYDIGKILKVGGASSYTRGTAANNKSYTIDINGAMAQTQRTENLKYARTFANSVVLPNGEVLVIGGIPNSVPFSDNGSVMTPEIWNPSTRTWRDGAQISVPRNYHSTALLLPDGRVLAAGGGQCGGCATNHPDAQIYSPSYLFTPSGQLATRPTLQTAPASAQYGQSIRVSAQGNVSQFVLMRYSTVSHSVNTDQRRIPISSQYFAKSDYDLQIPTDRGIAPPGMYMLFALDSNGVPSVSKSIQIGSVLPPNRSSLAAGAAASFQGGRWVVDNDKDFNGSDCTTDSCGMFGAASDIPIPGIMGARVGVFRPSSGTYYFDTNNNLRWDGCEADLCAGGFGSPWDLPVVRNNQIGVFRPSTGQWFFDKDNSLDWSGCALDECSSGNGFGASTDIPIIRNGVVGVFRPSTREWFFDSNNNLSWDGCALDTCVPPYGAPGDLPVVNPETGNIGVYRPSDKSWYMDINNNLRWDGCATDLCKWSFESGAKPLFTSAR